MRRIDLRWRGGGVCIRNGHSCLSAVGARLNTCPILKSHNQLYFTTMRFVVGSKSNLNVASGAESAATRSGDPWGTGDIQINTIKNMILTARLRNIHLIPAIGSAMSDENIGIRRSGMKTVGAHPFVIEDIGYLQGMNLNGGALTGGGDPQPSVKPGLLQVSQRVGIEIHMEECATRIGNQTRIGMTGDHGNARETAVGVRTQEGPLPIGFAKQRIGIWQCPVCSFHTDTTCGGIGVTHIGDEIFELHCTTCILYRIEQLSRLT